MRELERSEETYIPEFTQCIEKFRQFVGNTNLLLEKIEQEELITKEKIEKNETDYQRYLEGRKNEEEQAIIEMEKAQREIEEKLLSEFQKVDNSKARVLEKLKNKVQRTGHKVNPRRVRWEMLEEERKMLEDDSFLAFIKRLLKIGGYYNKEEMFNHYMNLMDNFRAYLLEEYHNQKLENQVELEKKQQEFYKIIEEKINTLKSENDKLLFESEHKKQKIASEFKAVLCEQQLPDYEKMINRIYDEFCIEGDGWEQYRDIDQTNTQLYLGNMLSPWGGALNLEQSLSISIKDLMRRSYKEGMLCIPYVINSYGNCRLLFEYDGKNGRKKISKCIQSIMMQIVRRQKLFSYEFIYMSNGTENLEQLTKLAVIKDKEVDEIHPRTGIVQFEMLKLCSQREDCMNALEKLNDYWNCVDRLLSENGMRSIEEFNKVNEKIIPQIFIIVENYFTRFNDAEKLKFENLLMRGKRCGISFIFTVDKSINIDTHKFCNLYEFTHLQINDQGGSVRIKEGVFPVELCDFPSEEQKQSFIEMLKVKFASSFEVDNRFERFIDMEHEIVPDDSTNKMLIPFAVNKRNKLISLELGSALTAHGLVSGGTGAGKSTMLHTIINSVLMKYSPEDVQVWLVDYKMMEFSYYMEHATKHIKIVGLQRDEEFTFAFLDYVAKEYARRQILFEKAGREKGVKISSLKDYREHFGATSIPRILIIVDEFHRMTQAIQDNEYKIELENQLSEIRTAGMTYLFSDQSITNGLRGLSDKGRDQIMVRLAMKNTAQEMKETLASGTMELKELEVKSANMKEGEVLFQYTAKETDAMGRTIESKKILEVRGLYLSNSVQLQIFEKLSAKYGLQEDGIFISGKQRVIRNEQIIEEYCKNQMSVEDEDVLISPGTPVNMDSCFAYSLTRNYNNNIMCIGDNIELRLGIFYHTVLSVANREASRMYIIMDRGDDFYRKNKRILNGLSKYGAEILLDYADICRVISELCNEVDRRRRHYSEKDIFVFWSGVDNLFQEMEMFPSDKPEILNKNVKKKNNILESQQELEDMFASLFMEGSDQIEPEEIEDDTLYDAREDLTYIIQNGSKYGIYSYVDYSSVQMLKIIKNIKGEWFSHKIALSWKKQVDGQI